MEDQVDLLGVQLMHMVEMMDAKLDRIEPNQEHLKEVIPTNGDRSIIGSTILKSKSKTTKRGKGFRKPDSREAGLALDRTDQGDTG